MGRKISAEEMMGLKIANGWVIESVRGKYDNNLPIFTDDEGRQWSVWARFCRRDVVTPDAPVGGHSLKYCIETIHQAQKYRNTNPSLESTRLRNLKTGETIPCLILA